MARGAPAGAAATAATSSRTAAEVEIARGVRRQKGAWGAPRRPAGDAR
ncbi:MAG: hypothetical protein AB7V42_02840 [Thermoleophilia bacterium]